MYKIQCLRLYLVKREEIESRGYLLSFILPKSSKTKNINQSYHDLMKDIAATKSALDIAYSNFENVVDPDLIDCYIYEMNAVQKRYKVLLERAKQIEML